MNSNSIRNLTALILAGFGLSCGAASAQVTFATQYGPAGDGQYTGPLFAGDTVTYIQTGSVNGTPFSLGTGPGTDTPTLTFSGVLGTYDNGQSGSSTDLSYLNHSYIYGGQPGSPTVPITITLSGVLASDTVDFKFLNAAPDDQAGSFTVTPLGGTASTPITVSSTTSFTDLGDFTGATSYVITATSETVYNTEISADLITVTPAEEGAVPEPSTWALMLSGFSALAFLARRRQIA